MKYNYEELMILLSQYEKALLVQTKFVESYSKFIFGDEEIKEKFTEFMRKELA